ncbi:MAG: PEP-CTERM sorting domain-containing protein [Thermoguttaceae bacterium]
MTRPFSLGSGTITFGGNGAFTISTVASTQLFDVTIPGYKPECFGLKVADDTSVTFSGFGDSYGYGMAGVICASGPPITISGGTITFRGNSAVDSLAGVTGPCVLSGGTNTFADNWACDGGALFGYAVINGGENTFTGNSAKGSGAYHHYGHGGAIHGVTTINGGENIFSGNSAGSHGGAIYNPEDIHILGGTNTFTGNSAGGLGGAIYMGAENALIAKDGDILFQGNKHRVGTANEEANAVYVNTSSSTSGNRLNLAATEGKSVLFYDPVESNSVYNTLAIDINNGEGYTGAILFDTYQSKVYGDTTVHNGTVELANGAVYGANGNVSFTLGQNGSLVMDAYSRIIANSINLNGAVTVDFTNYLAGMATDMNSASFDLSTLFVGYTNFGDYSIQGWESFNLSGVNGFDYVLTNSLLEFTRNEVPEPGTLLILGLAVVAAPLARRFRRR